jgi:glycogen debranching enzyme
MAADLERLARRRAAARVRLGRAQGDLPRSLVDLAALRFSPPIAGNRSLPAAGLPWFMTMFGRDSILTSLQALPFTRSSQRRRCARSVSGRERASTTSADEDPGRILHELRYGELAAFEERRTRRTSETRTRRRSSSCLLDEYELWSGDRKLVRELEYEARAALNWIDEYANLQGNGYISYKRRNEETGLENQCWKDSWDSISYRDGRLPASRGRPASCRATPTTRRCVERVSRVSSGRTRSSRSGSPRRPPT